MWSPNVRSVTGTRLSTNPRTWRSRTLQGILAVALVAAGAGGGIWWENRANAAEGAAATTRTQLVAATLGTVKQTVAATGTIQAAHQATYTFSSSGTVTGVDVAVGNKVTKGQSLATIGSADLQDAVDLLTDTLLSHLAYEERELLHPLARHGFYR